MARPIYAHKRNALTHTDQLTHNTQPRKHRDTATHTHTHPRAGTSTHTHARNPHDNHTHNTRGHTHTHTLLQRFVNAGSSVFTHVACLMPWPLPPCHLTAAAAAAKWAHARMGGCQITQGNTQHEVTANVPAVGPLLDYGRPADDPHRPRSASDPPRIGIGSGSDRNRIGFGGADQVVRSNSDTVVGLQPIRR